MSGALRRADAGAFVLDAYAAVSGWAWPLAEDDQQSALADLLADLRHLCDARGWDFGDRDRMAYTHYLDERGEACERCAEDPDPDCAECAGGGGGGGGGGG